MIIINRNYDLVAFISSGEEKAFVSLQRIEMWPLDRTDVDLFRKNILFLVFLIRFEKAKLIYCHDRPSPSLSERFCSSLKRKSSSSVKYELGDSSSSSSKRKSYLKENRKEKHRHRIEFQHELIEKSTKIFIGKDRKHHNIGITF